jgi:hypothetical protein
MKESFKIGNYLEGDGINCVTLVAVGHFLAIAMFELNQEQKKGIIETN